MPFMLCRVAQVGWQLLPHLWGTAQALVWAEQRAVPAALCGPTAFQTRIWFRALFCGCSDLSAEVRAAAPLCTWGEEDGSGLAALQKFLIAVVPIKVRLCLSDLFHGSAWTHSSGFKYLPGSPIASQVLVFSFCVLAGCSPPYCKFSCCALGSLGMFCSGMSLHASLLPCCLLLCFNLSI